MIRGKSRFICPRCGSMFEAPDIECRATVRTMPMPCPECGTPSPKADMRQVLKYILLKCGMDGYRR